MHNNGQTKYDARANALYRLKYLGMEAGLKTSDFQMVLRKFHLACVELNETYIFGVLICSTTWHERIRLLKTKIERSTDVDETLIGSEGNGRELLPLSFKNMDCVPG